MIAVYPHEILLWFETHTLHFLPWAAGWLGLILHHRHVSVRRLIDLSEVFKILLESQKNSSEYLNIKRTTQDLIFNCVQTARNKNNVPKVAVLSYWESN